MIGIEDPGYADARNIFSIESTHTTALPVDHDGLVIGKEVGACDYVYVTPSHQFPTTVTMPLERRQELLRRASRDSFVIFEDDYESEINFTGPPTPALKSLDTEDRVIYIGSLSKTLAPGLRMGYLVAPTELIREARALRRLMVRHPPTNNQRTIAIFVSRGHYDALIKRVSTAYRDRWEVMNEALATHLPDPARKPTFGGSSYWIKGQSSLDARELEAAAAERGILIEPGDVCFMHEPTPKNFFRLGVSSIPLDRIEPGIRQLAELIETRASRGRIV